MRIAIDNILPDPDRPVYDKAHRKWARRRRQRRMPIVLADKGKFYLLCGFNSIEAAERAGEDVIECVVRQGVSDEERESLRVADEYFSSLLPPIKMAESFIKFRDDFSVTQQELARRTGITAGTVHHYESLRKTLSPKLQDHVDRGDLTFKEARSIADMKEFGKQEELAAPFIERKLSSVHVEDLVARAKADPEKTSADLIAEFAPTMPKVKKPAAEVEVTKHDNNDLEPVPFTRLNGSYKDDLAGMQEDAFMLAGSLEKLASSEIPEYRRLRLVSTLRILSSRLNYALDHLNRYKTNGTSRTHSRSRPRRTETVNAR